MNFSYFRSDEKSIALARLYCWMIGFLYPAWSLIIYLFLPGEIDDARGRVSFGAAYLSLGALSLKNNQVLISAFPAIAKVGYVALLFHWFGLLKQSQMSEVYVMGTFIVAISLSMAFAKLSELIAFSVLLVVMATFVSLRVGGRPEHGVMLTFGLITCQAFTVTSLFMRSKIEKSLEIAEAMTKELQVEMQKRELEESRRQGEFRERLLRVIGHDLSSPLTVILQYNAKVTRNVQLGKIQYSSPDIQKAVEATFRAATQITEILARVKSYISGREEDRHVELVSLNDLV
ncbi:hypothetical protein E3A20_23760, partial [Planctomyces bekefii]